MVAGPVPTGAQATAASSTSAPATAANPADAGGTAAREPRRTRIFGWALALALALLTAAARMHVALADPEFDARDPSGMLKSDPALLYALVDRMVDAGGEIPPDFARDGTLEFPATIDVASRFPLGPLLLVAWIQRAFGGDTALHVTAAWVSALSMGAALLGVFLLARELSRSSWIALLAAALTAFTPAYHRSIGFVLVDEDFFWPILALHLGLAARAARARTPGSVALAAVTAAAAFATWHAAGFFLALEALVALARLAWTGVSPLAVRGAAAFPLALAAAAFAVPFLREAGAWSSIPVATAVGLWCAGRARSAARARAIGFGFTAALVASGTVLSSAGAAYGHVMALLAAKVEHCGIRPPTAEGLDGDVRILWQGPFETPTISYAAQALSIGTLLAIVAASWSWTRTQRASRGTVLGVAALFALSLGAAWFAQRALVLPALLAAPLAAWAAARIRFGAWLLVGSVLVQGALCWSWAANYANPWYHAPVQRQAEIRWMVEAAARIVPQGEAIAADFMSSTAILAHSGNPICFSPKWEAAEPRRRALEFLDAFHHRSPAEFRALLVERYRTRWLVVDRFTLQYLAHWSANLPADSFEPLPGTAAAALLSQDDAALHSIPGYELMARSPSTIRLANGAPSDFYRIYHLAP
jgi:hypothetical protein